MPFKFLISEFLPDNEVISSQSIAEHREKQLFEIFTSEGRQSTYFQRYSEQLDHQVSEAELEHEFNLPAGCTDGLMLIFPSKVVAQMMLNCPDFMSACANDESRVILVIDRMTGFNLSIIEHPNFYLVFNWETRDTSARPTQG